MIRNVFLVIELILRLFGLYDRFLDFLDQQRKIEVEEKRQKRDEALDRAAKAETVEDAYKNQEEITRNDP